MPLVWDFYRTVGAADNTGAAVHYYDESAQSIYLNTGIATQTADVEDGHWSDAVWDDEISITNDSYTLLSADHPANGTLYMAATDGTNLYYLRYIYAMDISDLCQSGTWKSQNDNAITQLSVNVKNTSATMFASEATLFNPGAKLALHLRLGDSAPYPIATAFLDEVDYEQTADTVPISGRNVTGFKLASQTFDLNNTFTGYSHEIAAAILDLAGVEDYVIQPGTGTQSFTFSYDTKILEGLQEMFAYYGWRMLELPDGKIVIATTIIWLTTSPIPITNSTVNQRCSSVKRRRPLTRLFLMCSLPARTGMILYSFLLVISHSGAWQSQNRAC